MIPGTNIRVYEVALGFSSPGCFFLAFRSTRSRYPHIFPQFNEIIYAHTHARGMTTPQTSDRVYSNVLTTSEQARDITSPRPLECLLALVQNTKCQLEPTIEVPP